jgi:hypothetical protein
MPPPTAWEIVRRFLKTNRTWMIEAQRKKKRKEDKKRIAEDKRRERQAIRKEKEKNKAYLDRCEEIRKWLGHRHMSKILDKVGLSFSFCTDIRYQVSIIACIFRVFYRDKKYEFSYSGECGACKKMDKYIPLLEEIMKNEK